MRGIKYTHHKPLINPRLGILRAYIDSEGYYMDILTMAMVSLGTGVLVGYVAGCYIYCNSQRDSDKA